MATEEPERQDDDDIAVAPGPQRHPGEWPFEIVLAGVVLGVGVVVVDGFRTGLLLAGAAVLLGAVLRAVLPERRAGLLVVRSRVVDVLTLAVMGGALVTLAVAVPARR